MTWLKTTLVLAAAFFAVFWEAAFQGVRQLSSVQVDLLPPLMVYASLKAGLRTVCLLALVGGLLFDSLSANPLGITVLPLLVVGFAYYFKHDLIVRDQAFAQCLLGLFASLTVPCVTLVLLLSTGRTPVLGWGTVWQILFMGVSGVVATPLTFVLFDWVERALVHGKAAETSFRPDREIRRGR